MHQINTSNENNATNSKNNIAQLNQPPHNHQQSQQIQMKPSTNDNTHLTINNKTTTSDLINDINNHLNINSNNNDKVISSNFQAACTKNTMSKK